MTQKWVLPKLRKISAFSAKHSFRIGDEGWAQELEFKTRKLGSEFWSGFKPATESELRQIETRTKRNVDPEFREFYRTVGYGDFRDQTGFAGCIYSPELILDGLACPIYFITGSMTQGAEWATEQQQQELWITRGRNNPNPKEFTDDALTLDGVKLYDLLQIGNNGGCCYHQLYVGPEPAPLRYCSLTESQQMEERAMTFSEGLEKMIEWNMQDEDS